jgi:hypothetical protein
VPDDATRPVTTGDGVDVALFDGREETVGHLHAC